jgi:hypothetical protein
MFHVGILSMSEQFVPVVSFNRPLAAAIAARSSNDSQAVRIRDYMLLGRGRFTHLFRGSSGDPSREDVVSCSLWPT